MADAETDPWSPDVLKAMRLANAELVFGSVGSPDPVSVVGSDVPLEPVLGFNP